MSNSFFPIPTPATGRLVIVARPRGNDWLEVDVEGWKKQGITTVVSLLEEDEAASLGLEREADIAERAGIHFISFPISDCGIPVRSEPFLHLTSDLARRIRSGETVAMHCRQSIGRAPLTAIGVLQALGQTTKSAVEAASKARGRPVPETLEQREWLDQLPANGLSAGTLQ